MCVGVMYNVRWRYRHVGEGLKQKEDHTRKRLVGGAHRQPFYHVHTLCSNYPICIKRKRRTKKIQVKSFVDGVSLELRVAFDFGNNIRNVLALILFKLLINTIQILNC